MGKARSIDLGTRFFAKAGDARTFFSDMLQKYTIGDRLSKEDEADLHALLKRHDEKNDKIGAGISYFCVSSSPEPYTNQRCFWIVRTDGSKEDFSYQHCLEKKPSD